MYFNTKIDRIIINNDQLDIFYKTGMKDEILISDLKDIFITVNKINPIYEFLIIMLFTVSTIFAVFYLQANLILIISSLFILVTIAKMNKHKRYGMKINLKNGITIKKRVPLKSKNDSIDFVNDVRKKIYKSKIESSNQLVFSI